MQDKKILVLGSILALALVAGLVLHLKNKTDSEISSGQTASTSPQVSISTDASGSNYTIELAEPASVEELAPKLDREVQFGASVPDNVRALLNTHIADVTARLKADTYRADDWFTLGVLYHSANDYTAARDVWEFLLRVIPKPDVAVVYDNLGKLYKFDLKDFPASESYFKLSMEADPTSIVPYIELFELYRYLYKTETASAVDILNDAAKKFPDATDPYTLLGSYYRERQEYAKARDAYTKALDRARDANDVNMISVIGNEINTLPQ